MATMLFGTVERTQGNFRQLEHLRNSQENDPPRILNSPKQLFFMFYITF
jgi:hypothetical protein